MFMKWYAYSSYEQNSILSEKEFEEIRETEQGGNYREFFTFTAAKLYVVKCLEGDIRRIRGSLQEIRRMKKVDFK